MAVQKTQPVHLAGSLFERPRHVCAFFHSRDEANNTLIPFITEGVEHGDKSFHIVDGRKRSAHEQMLETAGVTVPPEQRRSEGTRRGARLEIRTWDETYLLNGHFDQHRQLALIETVLTTGNEEGYPLTRLVANMEWALEPRPGVGDLVEYETRLNYVLPKYDDAVV